MTVRELADLSGVSSRSFYQRFNSKEDCFERTYEFIVRGTAKRVIASQEGGKDWEERMRLAFRAFIRELERDPPAARFTLVEGQAAWAGAKERTHWAEGLFTTMLEDSFAHTPENTPLPQGLCSALVAGAAFVARSRILWDEDVSSRLGDELAEWVLSCRRAYLDERRVSVSSSQSAISGGIESRPLRSSRDLIILATAKLAASGESDALALPRILKKAGVSGLTFDSQFDGIEDCLIATADSLADQTFGDAVQAKQLAGSWEEGVHLAMYTLCERAQQDPAIGRLWFTEIPALGPEGTYCCERLIAEVGDLIAYGSPSGSSDDVAIEASAGAIWEVLRQLAVGRAPEQAQARMLLASLIAAPHPR